MWLFTPVGFFSIVKADAKAAALHGDVLVVRARFRKDLETLIDRYIKPDLEDTHEIEELVQRDYPYRIYVDHVVLGSIMEQLVTEIDYTNFKNEVTKRQGHDRHALYSEVWHVMHNAEARLERLTFLKGTKR